MNRKHLITALAAVAFAGAAAAAGSPDNYGSAQPLAAQQTQMSPDGGLSREEVVADMNLWNAAGLGSLGDGENSIVSGPNAQERLAEYQMMRTGSTYVAEVERLGGSVPDTQAVAVAYFNDGTPFYYVNY